MITIIGMKTPLNKSNVVIRSAVDWKNALSASFNVLNPTRTGVPTAPNDTATLSAINADTTAIIGLKPKATINGAVTIAGVPKPDAPSMSDPNKNATIITWTRISPDIFWKPALIRFTAPVCRNVLSSTSAPNKIYRIVNVLCVPCNNEAIITLPFIPQTNIPNNVTTIALIIIPFKADIRSSTKKINGTITALKAINNSIYFNP